MSVVGAVAPARERLDTGMVVIVQRTDITPAATIHLALPAGGAAEPETLPGIASLTARLLDRGTTSRSAQRIDEELDERGVALRCSASRHSLSMTATCLAEDVPGVLDLLADVAIRPAFPAVQVERRRKEAITRLRQDQDNPFFRSIDALAAALYGWSHPYGRPFKGTVASVERISRDDLVAFHARTFQPQAATLAIVGDVEPGAAIGWAEAVFSDWRRGEPGAFVVPPPPPAGARRVLREEVPGKSQADIAYGFTAISRLDPRYHAYWLMNNILGEFGLGGRLAANIRERQGMAYYAFSSLESSIGVGPLAIRVGVDPADVPRALDAIDNEVLLLAALGPTPDEVDESRHYLINSIPRMFETNQSTAAFFQMVERFGLGLDYAARLPGLLGLVHTEGVAAAAAEVLRPQAATAVIAGPGDGLPNP